MTDVRLQELSVWTNELLDQLLEHKQGAVTLEPVSGDASFRRYFRAIVDDESYIAVDAPPEHEDNQTFVHVSNMLIAAGISAPKAYSVDFDKGFMLLVDLGDVLYLPTLLSYQQCEQFAEAEILYTQALDALVKIQGNIDRERLDPFSKDKLLEEMGLFEAWFCEGLLGKSLGARDKEICADAFDYLANAVLDQHQVAVHRDYHSRNLMVLDADKFGPDCGPGVIDFQDAVSGAYTYDLVSLLRDCYISWPKQQVYTWAALFLTKAQNAGLLENYSETQVCKDMDITGLQRQLKVLGIFSRLSIRDNKSQYLADIPLVIRYFLDISAEIEDMAEFRAWFVEDVMPLARQKLQLDT